MSTILTLTSAAAKMLVRNKQSLFFALFMPTIIMTIFGFIGFDKVPPTNVGVVAVSPNAATQKLIAGLEEISAFKIYRGSEAEERAALEKGDRAAVVLMPDALLPDAVAQTAPTKQDVRVLTNVSQQQQAGIVISVLTQMLDKTTLAVVQAPQLFEIKTEEINSQNVRYIDFLLPGIIAMSIMQMAIFSVAFVFVDYKEKGILKRLVASPLKPYQFVIANVSVRLVMALVQAAILMALGLYLLHAQVVGSYWLVGLVAFLGSLMFLGLGFTISGFARTVETVPAIANIVAFPMLFLSGVFYPVDAMPGWMQSIVQFLPLTYFAHALREVMTKGVGIGAIATDIYWMLGWAVVLIALANVTFSFEEKQG